MQIMYRASCPWRWAGIPGSLLQKVAFSFFLRLPAIYLVRPPCAPVDRSSGLLEENTCREGGLERASYRGIAAALRRLSLHFSMVLWGGLLAGVDMQHARKLCWVETCQDTETLEVVTGPKLFVQKRSREEDEACEPYTLALAILERLECCGTYYGSLLSSATRFGE